MSSCLTRSIAVIALLVISGGIAVSSASADVIQIPAIAFTERSNSLVIGDVNQGTLTNAQGKFYAAVPFPRDGERVCRFSLVHRDNDAQLEAVARLFKKRILVGDNPFGAPVLMARVRTGPAGAVSGVTVASDTSIAAGTLTLDKAFYYVELEVTGTTVEVLGVQIEFAPIC